MRGDGLPLALFQPHCCKPTFLSIYQFPHFAFLHKTELITNCVFGKPNRMINMDFFFSSIAYVHIRAKQHVMLSIIAINVFNMESLVFSIAPMQCICSV